MTPALFIWQLYDGGWVGKHATSPHKGPIGLRVPGLAAIASMYRAYPVVRDVWEVVRYYPGNGQGVNDERRTQDNHGLAGLA